MTTGIVILNYNTWDETIVCVESIQEFFAIDNKCKIYVVDNCSPQKPSEEELCSLKSHPNVEIIQAAENKGYSAGNNIGIKKALEDKCNYIVISNSDVIFVDNTLSKLQDYLEKNNNVGIVGPQIYDENGTFQPLTMQVKLTAWGKIKNMLLKTYLGGLFKQFEKEFIQKQELKKPKKVFGVSGCCFMLRNECAKYLYPLDERTFLYEEEYIIGVILESTNFDIYVIPDTHIIHKQGVSTGRISTFSYKCLTDSEQLYLKEYLHTNILMRYLILAIRKLVMFNIQ